MAEASSSDVTRFLVAWQHGDEHALEALIPLVYTGLRRLAHAHMAREQPGQTLQTTALVHETYLRLVDAPHVSFNDRAHFFAVCARLMRRILVDRARARHAAKRGGAAARIAFDEWLAGRPPTDEQTLAVDEALTRLVAADPRRGKVVEFRFFGGMTVDETAAVLGISPETVTRDWRTARLWLLHELRAHDGDPSLGR